MEGVEVAEAEEEVAEAAERRTRCASSGPAATVVRGRTAIFSTLQPRPIHLVPSAEAAVEAVEEAAAAEVEEVEAEEVGEAK